MRITGWSDARRRSGLTWRPHSSPRIESMADQRGMLIMPVVASSADDIVLTRAFTGLQTNMLRPSIVAAGLDPDLPRSSVACSSKSARTSTSEHRESGPARWRDIWSAGHSTSGVLKVSSVADLISQTLAEYQAA